MLQMRFIPELRCTGFLLMVTGILEKAAPQSTESPSPTLNFLESLLSTGHSQETAISDQCALPAQDDKSELIKH